MAQMESPDRRKRMTVRVDADLLDEYDALCDESGKSRSEAIRDHMRQAVEDANLTDREMPDDDDLAAAYRKLLTLTKGGGWVERDRACAHLAQEIPNTDKKEAYGYLIKPLRKQGYLRQQVSDDGRHVSLHVRS